MFKISLLTYPWLLALSSWRVRSYANRRSWRHATNLVSFIFPSWTIRTELKNFAELFCWPKWVWPEVQKQKHMAEGTGESQTEDYGFTHTHPHSLKQKHTDNFPTDESKEHVQTFKIRNGMHEHFKTEIFQDYYKNK